MSFSLNVFITMKEIRDSSVKLLFSAVGWFFGVFAIMEHEFWSAIVIHASTFLYFFFLFFFIRQNSGLHNAEKVSFWSQSNPSIGGVFSGRRIRNYLLFILTPIIIWSNWWPYDPAISTHDWGKIEKEAKIRLLEIEGINQPMLHSYKTSWNDSTTIKEYYLTTPLDSGILLLTVNKEDSLLILNFLARKSTSNH